MLKDFSIVFIIGSVVFFIVSLFTGLGSYMSATGVEYNVVSSVSMIFCKLFLVMGVGFYIFDKIKGR